jgi:hypothetical protein
MKNKKIRLLMLLTLFIASPSPAVSETRASALLVSDVIDHMLLLDMVTDKDCKTRNLTDILVVGDTGPDAVYNGRGVLIKGGWSEEWKLKRCGVGVVYKVVFTADGRGGTYFAVSLKKPK